MRHDVLRAGAGVTCESCHGPARDWVGVHNSYGVADSDSQRAVVLETPEHREQRIADSRVAGMRRPSDVDDLNDTIAILAVQTIIDLIDGVELKPNNRAALVRAADAIETATRSVIAGSSPEEILLQLQTRLETLYRALGRAPPL